MNVKLVETDNNFAQNLKTKVEVEGEEEGILEVRADELMQLRGRIATRNWM
jgi:hypothetical protein